MPSKPQTGPPVRGRPGQEKTAEGEVRRRENVRAATRGNLRAAKNAMALLVRRGLLLHGEEDRPAVEVAERLKEDLVSDLGGASEITAAQHAIVQSAGSSCRWPASR